MVKPYYESGGITIYHADCRDVLPTLDRVDHVITDPPFSERTHAGHDASACGHLGFGRDGADRKPLGYEAWDTADVRRFIAAATPLCSGWIVAMTDHILAPTYCAALEEAGRYTFAPLPYFAPGSRVRLWGDGPSSWTIWIVVARTKAQARWGTLPGGYAAGAGWLGTERMGGKPIQLMRAIVGDYSKTNETILDPFMGSGTTLVAAQSLGRRAIGIEVEERYCQIAVERLRQMPLPLTVTASRDTLPPTQGGFFNGSPADRGNETQDISGESRTPAL